MLKDYVKKNLDSDDSHEKFSEIIQKAGVRDLVRFVMFPEFETSGSDQKSVTFRLENLSEDQTYQINVRSISDYLLILLKQHATNSLLNLNLTKEMDSIDIKEMNL